MRRGSRVRSATTSRPRRTGDDEHHDRDQRPLHDGSSAAKPRSSTSRCASATACGSNWRSVWRPSECFHSASSRNGAANSGRAACDVHPAELAALHAARQYTLDQGEGPTQHGVGVELRDGGEVAGFGNDQLGDRGQVAVEQLQEALLPAAAAGRRRRSGDGRRDCASAASRFGSTAWRTTARNRSSLVGK